MSVDLVINVQGHATERRCYDAIHDTTEFKKTLSEYIFNYEYLS